MVEIRFLSQADREIHKIRSEHSKPLTKNFVRWGCLLIPAIVGCFFSGAGGGRTVIFCSLCKHICCKEFIFVGQNSEGQQSSFFLQGDRWKHTLAAFPFLVWVDSLPLLCVQYSVQRVFADEL